MEGACIIIIARQQKSSSLPLSKAKRTVKCEELPTTQMGKRGVL